MPDMGNDAVLHIEHSFLFLPQSLTQTLRLCEPVEDELSSMCLTVSWLEHINCSPSL